jgi:hypothetical protein
MEYFSRGHQRAIPLVKTSKASAAVRRTVTLFLKGANHSA